MATPLDLSKAAQEQFFAAVKQSQDIALAGIEIWVKNVTPLAGQTLPKIDAPTPEQLVATSFGFAEKLLATQKEFAQKVVATSAPVFEKTSVATASSK